MAEEKGYFKGTGNCTPITFNPMERWKQMHDLADGSYFVSDHGTIMRFNKHGYFSEISKNIHCGTYYVAIEYIRRGKQDNTRKRVTRLVVEYFVGKGNQGKKHRFRNNDTSDCGLYNLEWSKPKDVCFIALRRKLRSHIPAKVIQFNNTNERWKRMEDVLDGSFFISDYGRVMRFRDGIFREQKTFWKVTSMAAQMVERKGIKQTLRIPRMVLKYFVGGRDSDNRYWAHKNGDPYDCRLNNLRWKNGFIDSVDFEYLSKLNYKMLPEHSRISFNFMVSGCSKELFSLVKSYTPLLRYLDSVYDTRYFKTNDITNVFISVAEKLQKGYFKPTLKERSNKPFKTFVKTCFLKLAFEHKDYLCNREYELLETSKEVGYIPQFVGAQSNDVFF